MQKFLWISLLIVSIIAFIATLTSMNRGHKIEQQNDRICKLESSLAEYQKIQQITAEADKQAKEFEKELQADENTDNLDIVPADYILMQLHAD